ncbi:hypothetical protein [Mucilaginibacter ginkgonis]|uniref:Uncharacterized protein n=1 Tax=Mucilaginibacter ginkgonis TaxID=2682091 RepID=A0A6I4I1C6_9SPHI|nr:hypothetical protein [Mucilaginibacter ginkgonis]QQL50476.1 hypothetical protein GO620_003195 [Mucilaginibacter ginkgonis]
MNKLASTIIGGIAGAVALNVIHQVAKQFDHDAPRVDLVGEEALSKGLESVCVEPPKGDALFAATLASDLVSNAFYYSAIGLGKKKYLLYHGVAHGLCAGIGAITLPKPMGLSDAPVTKTLETKVLTVAWYTIGGMVAAKVMQALR